MKVLTKSEHGYVLEASKDEFAALSELSRLTDGSIFSEQWMYDRSTILSADLTKPFQAIILWTRLGQQSEELRGVADIMDESLKRKRPDASA